jgi:hypothetical protein
MKVLNSNGHPIVLNDMEQRRVEINQRAVNSLGYEINVTTLTTIMKKITEQKFFQIAPADYLPVKVGEGAWSSNLVTYRSFALGDDFSTGIINTGANNGRLASADAGVDSLTIKVNNWAKSIGWSLFDLQLASKSGNWDLVTAKENARKKNWDLGIQKIAFLGSGNSNCLGLYNQSGVTINAGSVIPVSISSMTTTQFRAFLEALLPAYRLNCAYTAWPTHFIIPESDYNGLAAPPDATYPLKSKLEILVDALKVITNNPNFKVLPNAYGIAANSGLSKDRYILLNYDEESVRMDIPVDYTNTLANSLDNFSFTNVGYGQFTGVLAYRPLEMLYLDLA